MSTLTTVTEEQFNDAVAHGPTLAFFMAQWCDSCKTMGLPIEALASTYKDQLQVIQVDFEATMELAVSQGVLAFPTMVFYQNGHEVNRLSGVHPQAKLIQVIESMNL